MLQPATAIRGGAFAIRLIVEHIEPATACPFCYSVIPLETALASYPADQHGFVTKCACPACNLLISESSWKPALHLRCRKMKKVQHRAADISGGAFRIKIKQA